MLIGCLFLSALTGFALADMLSDAQRAHRTGNYQEAAKLFQLAVVNESADAKYALGSMYTYGEGVLLDYQKAVKWYRLAAVQGHMDAQYTLGLIYGSGQQGLPQDYREAVKWYRLAAEMGNAGAQANLGMMYIRGFGVSRNLIHAHMWLDLASARGIGLAQQGRAEATEEMTPFQISKAQKMAKDCKFRNYKNCD